MVARGRAEDPAAVGCSCASTALPDVLSPARPRGEAAARERARGPRSGVLSRRWPRSSLWPSSASWCSCTASTNRGSSIACRRWRAPRPGSSSTIARCGLRAHGRQHRGPGRPVAGGGPRLRARAGGRRSCGSALVAGLAARPRTHPHVAGGHRRHGDRGRGRTWPHVLRRAVAGRRQGRQEPRRPPFSRARGVAPIGPRRRRPARRPRHARPGPGRGRPARRADGAARAVRRAGRDPGREGLARPGDAGICPRLPSRSRSSDSGVAHRRAAHAPDSGSPSMRPPRP